MPNICDPAGVDIRSFLFKQYCAASLRNGINGLRGVDGEGDVVCLAVEGEEVAGEVGGSV